MSEKELNPKAWSPDGTLWGLPIKFTESVTAWQSRELKPEPGQPPFVELSPLAVEAATGAYAVPQEIVDKLLEAEKPCVRCGGCGNVVDLDGGGFTTTAPASDYLDKKSRRCPDCSVYRMEWVWRDDGSPSWFCGCGTADVDKRQVLADILNCFSSETSMGSPYSNLKAFEGVAKKYTQEAVELILYLLDEMGYAEHGGSVACSQWLTPLGERLRAWANDPKWDDEDDD